MKDDPLGFRVGILWKYVLPVAMLALVVGATLVSRDNHSCRSFCLHKGFAGSRYTPPGRGGAPRMCHCLTEAETQVEKRVPAGTQVFPWTP